VIQGRTPSDSLPDNDGTITLVGLPHGLGSSVLLAYVVETTATRDTQTEQDEMICCHRKVVLLQHPRHHRSKCVIADFRFIVTLTANEMMVGSRSGDFKCRFDVSSIGAYDDAKFHEEAQRAIDGRSVNRSVDAPHPSVDVTKRRMASTNLLREWLTHSSSIDGRCAVARW